MAFNHAAGNAQFGLVVGASSDVRVVGNDVSGNPAAGILSFDLIDGLLAGNGATGNGVGILLAGGQNGSHGNRVLANRAVRNDDVGILLDSGADENEVRGNEASGNGGGEGGGIVVFESTGNVLADNVANANAADGIRIEEEEPGASAGNTLTRNVANRNGGHGIDAVAGTIDGGGNRAATTQRRPTASGWPAPDATRPAPAVVPAAGAGRVWGGAQAARGIGACAVPRDPRTGSPTAATRSAP